MRSKVPFILSKDDIIEVMKKLIDIHVTVKAKWTTSTTSATVVSVP